MRASPHIALLLAPVLLLTACEGLVTGLGSPLSSDEADGGGDAVACNVATASLNGALATFTNDVWPALSTGDGHCASCHATGSGRRFILSTSASDTFFQARAGGYFKDEPGSLLARLSAADDRTRMPPASAKLSSSVLTALANVACQVRAADTVSVADEQFPPELLTPYTGPANTSWDDPFINFVQLRSKVKSIFSDAWVRGGIDQFDKNVGLFGGVDFRTHFVEARAATPDFLLGMDVLAPEVCGTAADAGTGPFKGLTLTAEVVDVAAQVTTSFEVESLQVSPATGAGSAATNPAGYFCYTDCSYAAPVTLLPGQYQVVVRAKAQNDSAGNGPKVGVQLGTQTATLQFSNASAFEEKSATLTLTAGGALTLTVGYINDGSDPPVAGGDRNITFDNFRIIGPLGAGTGTSRETAARATLSTVYERLLYRAPSADELTKAYGLLKDLAGMGPLTQAWSGVCEGLMRHPDFLFTLPPSYETATTGRDRLLLVGLAQQMVGRPPTQAEFEVLTQQGYEKVVDGYLVSADFRDYFYNRIQLRIESQGTAESNEPARLWAWVVFNGHSYEEVLTGDYSVDEAFAQQTRSAEHGKTGVLTMKGYLNNKPGLPHYNYPARVLSGFMGSIFEVPPEVFDQRGTATAASTVDPTSICFNCHQLLTPLAHQRLKWADDGTFHATDAQGALIDDTDRGLVPTYPYKGAGLEAFSTHAVKKEPFIRRMINTEFKLLMGRELRSRDDERALYKQLWDTTQTNGGDLRKTLKAIAVSDTFKRTHP